MSRVTTTAAIQLCATPDVAANLTTLSRLARDAADAGAEVIMVPEAFAFLGPEREKQQIVEPLPTAPSHGMASGPFRAGPILTQCQDLARETRCHLILGGFHEASDHPDKCYNTCVHLTPEGAVAACYRKIHLFDISLSDGTALRESARTLAGDAAVTTELPFGRLGLSVCYDIRFPYLYQRLVDLGAEALTVPSAFTRPTGAAHWHVLLRARAIECQSYVIAPAQHGHNWGKRTSYGHSVIIDPWGQVLAELPDGDGFIVADIDPEETARVRRELPSLEHRRNLP